MLSPLLVDVRMAWPFPLVSVFGTSWLSFPGTFSSDVKISHKCVSYGPTTPSGSILWWQVNFTCSLVIFRSALDQDILLPWSKNVFIFFLNETFNKNHWFLIINLIQNLHLNIESLHSFSRNLTKMTFFLLNSQFHSFVSCCCCTLC